MMYYWRRIGAFVIDLSIVFMLQEIVRIATGQLFMLTGTDLVIDIFKIYAFLLITVFIAVGYNVGCYHYFKFPLGKLLMSIKVYNHRGRRVSTRDFAKREFNKYVLLFATFYLYAPYQFLRYVTAKQQTYHERQSKTHIYV